MNPKVTVVLPTFNEEESIETAVQSILDQSYENIELFVVDDESTDRTQEVVRSVDDNRVKLYVRDEGEKGLTQALNFGINKANGKYIARQDADDWSDKNRLHRQVELAEKMDVDIVGTGCYNMDRSGNRKSERAIPTEPDLQGFNSGSQFVHGSLMFRRDMLEEIGGYNQDYRTAEDVEILARADSSGYEFQNINEPLYYFTIDDESKYRSDVRETTLHAIHAINSDRFEMHPQEFAEISDENLSEHLTEEELNKFYREMAQESLRFGRRKKARYYSYRGIPSPIFIPIFILSFLPTVFVNMTIRVYRGFMNYKRA